jgi:hypothetical protein
LFVPGFDDPFWTIEQTIAWIAFHDRDLVEAISADRLRKPRLFGSSSRIYFNQTALGKYIAEPDPRSEKKEKHRKASMELRTALQRGEVVASNRPKGAAHRAVLSKLHWVDHHFSFDAINGVFCSGIPGQRGDYNDEVRFESDHIKERWPAQSDSVAQKRSAEEMAYDEFYRVMKASPHKRTRTKDPWVKELVEKFPGLKTTAAKNEWRQAAINANADAWRWSGRPRKKP